MYKYIPAIVSYILLWMLASYQALSGGGIGGLVIMATTTFVANIIYKEILDHEERLKNPRDARVFKELNKALRIQYGSEEDLNAKIQLILSRNYYRGY